MQRVSSILANGLLLFAFCLPVLSGCQGAPATGLEPTLSFTQMEPIPARGSANFLVSQDRESLLYIQSKDQKLYVRSSHDSGATWNSKTPLPMKDTFSYGDPVTASCSSGSVVLLARGRGDVLPALSSDQGESWTWGKRFQTKGTGRPRLMDGGETALLALCGLRERTLKSQVSTDGGQTWKKMNLELKLPSEFETWVFSGGAEHGTRLVVDQTDNFHLFVPDCELRLAQEEKVGALYVNYSIEGELIKSEFWDGYTESFQSDFGENSTQSNVFYRLRAHELQEKDKSGAREARDFRMLLSVSPDAGASWSDEFEIAKVLGSPHGVGVEAKGDVWVAHWSLQENSKTINYYVSSSDGGKSWTKPVRQESASGKRHKVALCGQGLAAIHETSQRGKAKKCLIQVGKFERE